MQTVAHTMPPPGRAQRRLAGLTFALLLQAGFIAALIYGLRVNVWPINTGGIETKFIPAKQVGHMPPPPSNTPWVEPQRVPLPEPPVWDPGNDREQAITPPPVGPATHAGPADHGPIGVMSTHTTPPYPPMALHLGQEGTVVLRLAVSPQGVVTEAVVLRSSGFPMLDDAARSWVMAHWRYQPAQRGGAAAAGAVTVGVEFNLRNAG
ncbi:MAG TPA: TonB family protein [Rhizomicrobium sp.]|nr:TonB family protein [Rhizomicrobium sp.]